MYIKHLVLNLLHNKHSINSSNINGEILTDYQHGYHFHHHQCYITVAG
jgi:hypothetical protein